VDDVFKYRSKENISLKFNCTKKEDFYARLFTSSCSPEFLTAWMKKYSIPSKAGEEDIFSSQKHQLYTRLPPGK
jgi:hypothetical protein